MKIHCWAFSHGRDSASLKVNIVERLQAQGVDVAEFERRKARVLGFCVASEISPQLHHAVQSANQAGAKQIIVVVGLESAAGRDGCDERLGVAPIGRVRRARLDGTQRG